MLVIVVFDIKHSAIAIAPAFPILLLSRVMEVIVEFNFKLSAIAIAPGSVILL